MTFFNKEEVEEDEDKKKLKSSFYPEGYVKEGGEKIKEEEKQIHKLENDEL